MKRLANSRTALVALGVFLGRGAQADTVLDFEVVPAGQDNGGPVIQSFGDHAATSSSGVTVTGFGTPNIGVTWGAVGFGDTQWDFYHDGGSVWNATQLNDSAVGTRHLLTFTPNSASARVVIKSFNLHPYYISDEKFTYAVSVLAGTNVVSGPTNVSFVSDAAKHLVSLNHTGALGQTLKLKIERLPSTLVGNEYEGNAYDIAADDFTFAQLPEAIQPVGPQVVSVMPADDGVGVPAIYSYMANITNGATTVVANSIQLKFDDNVVSPPPSISSAGGLTNVSYQAPGLLALGSTHRYTLTYDDNLGSNYLNEVQFTVVANYVTLPAAYALPPGSGVTRGFTHRTVSASLEAGPANADTLFNSVARAKAQLAGTLINTNVPPFTNPYTNSAMVGPNPDGSFNVDTVLNFSDEVNLYDAFGDNFPNDMAFPGLPPSTTTGITNQSFATESRLFLELPAGYYRFGVNSDDGFEVSVDPPAGVSGANIVVGVLDDGRGAADSVFDFLVQASGIYSFKVIFFEGWGDASCEFFSVDLANGQKVLINDTNANAVASYRVLKPRITSIVKSGSDVVLDWAYGVPPFQVQFKTNITDISWSNVGSPTSSRTASVPIQPPTGFMRISGSP